VTAVQKLDLSPKALAGALVGTIVVLIAATWFIMISPKHSQASNLNAQIQSAQSDLQTRQHAARQKVNAAAQAVKSKRAMPDTVAMPQILLELNRVAQEENISIDSVTPAAPTPFTSFEAVPITVVISGRYFDVEAFLKELRNQVRVSAGNVFSTGRLFDVSAVNVSQTTPAPRVSATLSMDAFVYSGLPVPTTPGATTTTTAGA